MIKRIALCCSFLIISHIQPFPKTEYPVTHFFLNLLGSTCIIKGSSIQIPVLNWILHIDRRIDREMIILGISLLITSRCLRILEKMAHKKIENNQELF